MRYSKMLSTVTAGYAVYCAVRPRHLAEALEVPADRAPETDRLARTYTGRDLPLAAVALLSRDPRLVRAAMALRLTADLTDATVLGSTTTGAVRTKVLAVTLGYGALHVAALLADSRAERTTP
jgi:hypothetical protein